MAPAQRNGFAITIYTTRDGRTYKGTTAYQVVDAIRADGIFTEHESIENYMQGAAKRYAAYEELQLRSDTPDNFLADLVSRGVLTKAA